MRQLSQRDTVVLLLETFVDVRDAAGRSGQGDGDLTPMMAKAWREGSYRQLETVLREMRACPDRHEHALVPVCHLYWHVAEHYIRCEWRIERGRKRIVEGRKARWVEDDKQRRRVRIERFKTLPKYREHGIAWITDQRPSWQLPDEILYADETEAKRQRTVAA